VAQRGGLAAVGTPRFIACLRGRKYTPDSQATKHRHPILLRNFGGTGSARETVGGNATMIPTQPGDPDFPEIEEPQPNSPEETPIDTPQEVPQRREPDWRSPGTEEPPMRMPGEQPDPEAET